MRWGATDAEAAGKMYGDRYIPENTVVSTRAITINAPVERVWYWIAQMGQGRAGFYSFDWLENLFAANMQNAEEIHLEWAGIRSGDRFSLQENGPFVEVAVVQAGDMLVMLGGWSFYVEAIDETSTRLVVRYASFPLTDWTSRLYYYTIFEPAHYVMEAGMMLGIKRRAETEAGS